MSNQQGEETEVARKKFKSDSPQESDDINSATEVDLSRVADKPPTEVGDNENDSQDEEEEEETTNVDRYWPLPVDCKVNSVVSYQGKRVTALAFNNSGTRFAAASQECQLKIWDFGHINAIRTVNPCGQTVINNIDYAPNDEMILVIAANCQASIISKDGQSLHQCPKGDQYLKDMSNTKGHVQILNDGCFHPRDRSIFMTSSNDGTLRIWNINNLKQQDTVIKVRSPGSGLKAVPNICRYSRDSLSVATGCNDGCLMMWDTRRKFITTSACVKNAHSKGNDITGIDFSYNLNKVCTRSEDETCKLWDLRKLKDPIKVHDGLKTIYSNSDCVFSPDDKLILVGVPGDKKDEPGCVKVLDELELTTLTSIDTEEGSVVRCRWHPRINHIAYTTSTGTITIGYDKLRSLGGFVGQQIGQQHHR